MISKRLNEIVAVESLAERSMTDQVAAANFDELRALFAFLPGPDEAAREMAAAR